MKLLTRFVRLAIVASFALAAAAFAETIQPGQIRVNDGETIRTVEATYRLVWLRSILFSLQGNNRWKRITRLGTTGGDMEPLCLSGISHRLTSVKMKRPV